MKNEEVVVESAGSLRWRLVMKRRRRKEMVLSHTIQDTGDLMPARRTTCLKPTSVVKAQAFAPLSRGGEKKLVPYEGIEFLLS